MNNFFSTILLKWHAISNFRNLAWKNINDPYKIWLSEILLQQTRAEQVVKYYALFVQTFPTIFDLANADDQKIFAMWQGLGYYSRCRNMIATARHIVTNCQGIFPKTYQEILQLKGCGSYTASAIASFAYNSHCAVVDGNVYRVLARVFGIHTAIDSTAGKQEFQQLATALLPKGKSKLYNQAIMDFGATVCTPKKPLCSSCVFINNCIAFQKSTQSILPVKTKQLIIKTRHFHYIVFQSAQYVYIKQRLAKDIWQNLHEFYLIESKDAQVPPSHILPIEYEATFIGKQKLTHQVINAYFYEMPLKKMPKHEIKNYIKVKKSDLGEFAFAKVVLDYLKKEG